MKSRLHVLAFPALLALLVGCASLPTSVVGEGSSQSPNAPSTGLAAWLAIATQQRISPASATTLTGDVTSAWIGADGNAVEAVVLAPRPTSGMTISLSPVSGDNGGQISNALVALSAAGGGQLNLAPGVYNINGSVTPNTPLLSIKSLHDITISGAGATLMMMQWGTGINISTSQRIHLIGVTIRYATPAIVTGAIIANGSGIGLHIDPSLVQTTGPLTIYQVTTLNATGPGYSITGNRLLLGTTGVAFTSLGNGNYTNSQLTGFKVGDKVAVKLTYYLGAGVVVNDSGTGTATSDIILDAITIANSSGMGVIVDRMGRGLVVENSFLGPVTAADGTTSIPYDGIHVVGAAGDLLLLNNQIVGTGDDGINLAGQILTVAGPGTTTGTVRIANGSGITTGETIHLFDAQLNYIGSGVETTRTATASDGTTTVTFATPVPNSDSAAFAREGAVLSSRYTVSGNMVANCDCHGLLAQVPNGLISGNTFSGLAYNGIRLITSGHWGEGTGALNVVVTNNTIKNTGADTKAGFVWAAITAYGEIDSSTAGLTQMTKNPVNGDLLLTGNIVTGTQDACLSIGDTVNATLQNTTCTQTMLGGPPKTGSFASYSGSDALRSQGIYIDPQTTSNVIVTQ